jgi:hypothetical protein
MAIHCSVLTGDTVRRRTVLMLALLAGVSPAQTPLIRIGVPAYIEPMAGYELDLAAALMKKKVPLIVVRDRARADVIIIGKLSTHSPVPPAVILSKNGQPTAGFPVTSDYPTSQTEANITLLDAHSSRVIFTYSVDKGSDSNQRKSTAEACAKHLKQYLAHNPIATTP